MPSRSALSVSLTPELTAYVAAQLSSGRYRIASEVVRASLWLLWDEPVATTAPLPASERDRTDGSGTRDGGRR